MFFKKRRRKIVRKKSPDAIAHYQTHKELARKIIHARLAYWSQVYNLEYKRVSIKNQRTCWGSCSEYGNLNFNYKIIFLPKELMDYVIVHEMCHLLELNHSKVFWMHVAKGVPDYIKRKNHLRKITNIPTEGFPSSVYMETKKASL